MTRARLDRWSTAALAGATLSLAVAWQLSATVSVAGAVAAGLGVVLAVAWVQAERAGLLWLGLAVAAGGLVLAGSPGPELLPRGLLAVAGLLWLVALELGELANRSAEEPGRIQRFQAGRLAKVLLAVAAGVAGLLVAPDLLAGRLPGRLSGSLELFSVPGLLGMGAVAALAVLWLSRFKRRRELARSSQDA